MNFTREQQEKFEAAELLVVDAAKALHKAEKLFAAAGFPEMGLTVKRAAAHVNELR